VARLSVTHRASRLGASVRSLFEATLQDIPLSVSVVRVRGISEGVGVVAQGTGWREWCSTDPEGGDAMPQEAWSKKRERQYKDIKSGLEERGDSEELAEEIAARTVNKERARAGESKQSSALSIRDISSGRRGGLRSHRGAGGRTRDQLYEEARRRGIKGRSKMTKKQLERAVDR
jgi:hypothetical protein